MKEIASKSLLVLLIILSVSVYCVPSTQVLAVETDLSTIRVAMWPGYSHPPIDNYDMISGAALAPKAMMEWVGCTVDFVRSLHILQGLSGYDILFVCGWPVVAWGNGLLDQLSVDHIEKINNFVANGGIYVGLCGGAALGCTYIDKGATSSTQHFNGSTDMDLFNGTGVAPIHDYESPCMVTINVNTGSTGPDLSGMNSSYTVFYNYGPYFKTFNWTGIHILARYSVNDEPAIIALQKERGCVVLCGLHPEWEENSDRDAGGTWDNTYDDPDSEWDLMKAIIQWCVDTVDPLPTSTSSNTTSTSPTTSATNSDNQSSNLPLLLGFSGVALAAIVIAIAYRRK